MIILRLITRMIGIVALLVILAILIGSGLPSPQIAYEARHSHANYDIHLLDVRWRIDVPLTRTDHGERHPAWSPDGRTLAFSSDRGGEWDIYTLDVDNPHLAPQQITNNDGRTMNPAWSPDGKTLAFDSTHEGNLELYLMPLSVDTLAMTGPNPGDMRRLTYATGVDESPAWSPDGQQIAFASYRDSDLDIYVLDLPTGDTRNITRNLMYNEWGVDWSPDNTQLTFASTRNSSWQVYRGQVGADGPADQVTNLSRDVAGAVWSPDGQWLAVELYDTIGTRSLYILPSDAELATDRDLRRLTLGDSDDRFIAWRPPR
jgi:Tol biopolymer transport system component